MTNTSLYSWGLGIGTQNNAGEWLEIFYPRPMLEPSSAVIKALEAALQYRGDTQVTELDNELLLALKTAFTEQGLPELAALVEQLQDSTKPVVATLLAKDYNPSSVPEIYLKLHLLSHRLVKPHQTDLTGMFGILPNVAWTSAGAIALDELPQRQLEARLKGELLEVMSVDKFPKMTNYVVPTGVRIADTDRVRLGAHLGEGTTVMHEGFVNFNAGTKGASMVEGRISAGVVVGEGSDLGGGCSTMGTLSGGGNIVISVGNDSLIGANAGLGIPLGDRCIIESGLYITAGTKVTLLDASNNEINTLKARELAGKPDLLFRRNSQTGRIECKINKAAVALNEELHANN
jgi:2,3,4,5-tetrahydropyridine-2-carboxylate N-succinyltransferase